jgi:GGDEF domain-containing protein
VTDGWVVIPLVLLALVAVVMAVIAKRARAEADRRERSLLSRVDVLERALASSAEEPPAPEPGPEPEPAPLVTDASAGGGGGAVPGGEEGDEEVPDTLTDPLTGLFNESFFRVTLDTRVSAARRHLRPVAVVLVQVAQGVREGTTSPVSPMVVADGIRATLRDADTACRLDDGRFALILEDTPENGAVWTVERVRRALAVDHPGQTLWAGIACYPAHAFDAWELFDRAGQALDAAQEWHQDRIEVATSE